MRSKGQSYGECTRIIYELVEGQPRIFKKKWGGAYTQAQKTHITSVLTNQIHYMLVNYIQYFSS